MRAPSSILALLCAAQLTGPAARADGGRRPFALLGPDQGLPPGAALSLAQDEDSFIWMGTESGLVRYEGGQFRRWTTADGLPSALVSRLFPAAGGGLWAVTQRGLARFRAGRFELARLTGELPGSSVSLGVQDRQGRAWVSTQLGLYRQRDGMEFERVPGAAPPLHALAAGGRSGAVWIATSAGVTAFGPDGRTRSWGAAEGAPSAAALLAEDGAGRLWAGSGRLLAMLEPGADRFTDQSRRLPAGLSPNSAVFLDGDGSLWLPTQEGALHLGRERDEVLGSAAGLPFHWVRSVFRDREGSLWVMGPALARLQGGGRVWNYTLSREATGVVVWTVARDRRGTLVVGTDDGAARLEEEGLVRIPGTAGLRIKGLVEDRSGTLWMVSTLGPALWLRAGKERAERAPLGELGSPLNSVFEDSRGRVWLGHGSRGVLRWDPAAQRLIEEAGPAQLHRPVLGAFGFREDAEGRLWVGCDAGLLVREPEGGWHLFGVEDGLEPYAIRGLTFLADGSAWLHHQEPRGLTRVRLRDGKLLVLERRTQGKGLRSSLIYGVAADAAGRVWASTDQGLDRLDPPLHVGRHDGMVSEDCSIHALLVEEGRVWVGTSAGLVRYESGGPDPAAAPLQAFLLAAELGSQRLEPPFGALAPLPAREATVVFRYAAPSYVNERDVRFQVRLLGLEDDWRETQSRLVRYPALPGGSYRFEVRAARGEGGFGEAAALDLVVLPPWWKTWWALALLLCSVAAATAGLVLLRVSALARSKALLEALVATRTAELSARNQELSEALGEVKELSGMLPICMHCHKIRNDKGYWTRIEQYISARTRASFSHGLCPDCLERHYPA